MTRNKGAQHWLTLDIADYLMERPFDIGTNFKDEFPNSYVDESGKKSKIILIDDNGEKAGTIILNIDPEWEKLHG